MIRISLISNNSTNFQLQNLSHLDRFDLSVYDQDANSPRNEAAKLQII